MPDRATRLPLHLERVGQKSHYFPLVSGTFGPDLTTPLVSNAGSVKVKLFIEVFICITSDD